MLGPHVTWYLALSAVLFATGTLGVLLRRSPLIVLLSLEIVFVILLLGAQVIAELEASSAAGSRWYEKPPS